MKSYLYRIIFFIMALSGSLIVFAHPATERYIPIGQSPGISYKYTVMGNIEKINKRNQTITMSDETRRYTVSISKKTKIWLDRSKAKLGNLPGTFTALKQGNYVEVKFVDPETKKEAAWIKIESK